MERIERSFYFMGGVALIALGLSVMNAKASGFDNTGIGSLDLLYDPAKFAVEFGASYIDRNVDYKATKAQRFNIDNNGDPYSFEDIPGKGNKVKARATPNVTNYQAAVKVGITDNIDCLARALNPGTILEDLPGDWDGNYSVVTTDLQTFGLDTTCSIKFAVGPGYLRLIGGGRYVQADLNVFKHINLLGFVDTTADLNVAGSGFGYSAGLAFEVPEYAIRASVVYDSQIAFDATGSFETPTFTFGSLEASAHGNATAELTMPQAVEVNLQSGIAPKWLAMLSVKWVNWSVLDKLTVNIDGNITAGPVTVPIPLNTSRHFNFKDGWTIRAGVGHQLTDKLAVAGAVTWDQGIGGSYSDTWQLSLGGAYDINENVKLSLGGALAYKTAAKNELVRNTTQIGDGNPTGDQFNLSYDSSLNFGVMTKLKLHF